MLQGIVRLSLQFRGVIVALACVLAGYGAYVLTRAKYDVYPEFAPPQVSIQTEAPGLSPEEVEALVTRPIENAINGVVGLETLRSQPTQCLTLMPTAFEEPRPGFR